MWNKYPCGSSPRQHVDCWFDSVVQRAGSEFGQGLSRVLHQFFGAGAVHQTAGLATGSDPSTPLPFSVRAAFVVAGIWMLLSSMNQCLVKWYNLIQTKLPVTSEVLVAE